MKHTILRLAALLLAVLMVLSLCACGKPAKDGPADGDTPSLETLEGILAAIYATGGYSKMLTELIEAPIPTDEDVFYNYLITTEITADNCAYFLGKSGIEFERAIASEAAMQPTTYSLCLVQVKEGANAERVADVIRRSADPMKWVCTGVSPKDVYVEAIDDVVILIMSGSDGSALLAAFREVMKNR